MIVRGGGGGGGEGGGWVGAGLIIRGSFASEFSADNFLSFSAFIY